MPTESEAVELLGELGLSEYEARCFVALSRVGTATAREVSDLSDVPRSRVYDTLEALHERGLVDVQQSDPREYRAVSTDAAIRTLREQYADTLDEADSALGDLEEVENPEESGAWAISDHDHVNDRIATLVEDADDEVYVLVVEERVADRASWELLSALDDHVSIVVEAPTPEFAEEALEAVPSATVTVTELASRSTEIDGKWLGRIVLVDRRAVLISSFSEGIAPGRGRETAIWAAGVNHGLVVGLRHLLSDHVDELLDSGPNGQ